MSLKQIAFHSGGVGKERMKKEKENLGKKGRNKRKKEVNDEEKRREGPIERQK